MELHDLIGKTRTVRRYRETRKIEEFRLRELVEHVWLQLGGPYAYAGASELDNAAEFLALLDRTEREGQGELLERLNEALEGLYARGKPAKVQLMTIH